MLPPLQFLAYEGGFFRGENDAARWEQLVDVSLGAGWRPRVDQAAECFACLVGSFAWGQAASS